MKSAYSLEGTSAELESRVIRHSLRVEHLVLELQQIVLRTIILCHTDLSKVTRLA